MDEKKLAELFNDAVRDVPPASFDTGQIRRASHRATIKRRNSIVAGSALALVLLAGGTLTTVSLSGEMKATTASTAGSGDGVPMANNGTMDAEGNAQPPAAPAPRSESSHQLDNRVEPPKQGGASPGNAGGAGSTLSGCKADRELAAALAGELPAAASRIEVAVPFGCPEGSRAAAFAVTDGVNHGTISIVVVPAGVEPGIAPMGGNVDGYFPGQALAASGALVYVVSQPASGSEAPLANEVARYAAEIGKRY